MAEFSQSASNTLTSLKSRDPYSSWTLSNYINTKGEKLLFLKKRGIAVHSKPHKTIWLRAHDNAICGSETAFVSPESVLVTGDLKLPQPSPRRETSTENNGDGDFLSQCTALLEKMKEKMKEGQFDFFDPNHRHFPFIVIFGLFSIFVGVKLIRVFRSFIWLLPLFFVLKSTIPSIESFDAKKELKRVLRKDHLPEEHSEKPKGWLEKMATKAVASLAGEAMTAAGYTIKFDTFLSCVRIAEVELDLDRSTCVWIGVVNKWYFLRQVTKKDKKNKRD